MESEGDAKCLLVVDEKETCLAHFVPEHDLEKIWNESERTRDPGDTNPVQKTESIYEYTHSLLQETCNKIDRPKKATEHPSFRRKILDKIHENLEEASPAADEKFETEIDTDLEQTQPTEKKHSLVKTWSLISKASQVVDVDTIKERGSRFVLDILPNIVGKLYLYLGNKWTWNVIVSLVEICISVFVYLVLACATIMVTVIINYHDANTRCNKQVQSHQSEIDKSLKRNAIKEEEESGIKRT